MAVQVAVGPGHHLTSAPAKVASGASPG